MPTLLWACLPHPSPLPACLLKQEGAGAPAWHPDMDPTLVEATGGEGRCFSQFPSSCTQDAFHLPPEMAGSITWGQP